MTPLGFSLSIRHAIRKRNSLAAIIMVSLLPAITGCTQEMEIPGNAQVGISILSKDSTSCRILFTPDHESDYFTYAIGDDNDYEAFGEGLLDNTERAEGNSPVEIEISGLEPGHVYAVFAQCTDKQGRKGSICTAKFRTADGIFRVELQYLLDKSAGFTIHSGMMFSEFKYYLGKPGEKDEFLSDKAEITYGENHESLTVNYYDLDPSTGYVFYAIAYDRIGAPGALVEIPVTTMAEGECPGAEFEAGTVDFYKGTYYLHPNADCGKIAAITGDRGEFDSYISYNEGNVIALIEDRVSSGEAAVAENGETLEIGHVTDDMIPGTEIEIYYLLYGNDGKPAGIGRILASTPEIDPDLPKANVSVEISSITHAGATYDFTADDNTVMFFYDTVDADWWDELKETSQWHEYYIHETLLSQGFYYAYRQSHVRFAETACSPQTRYYAAACPINANGPGEGWGPATMAEYTTAAAE